MAPQMVNKNTFVKQKRAFEGQGPPPPPQIAPNLRQPRALEDKQHEDGAHKYGSQRFAKHTRWHKGIVLFVTPSFHRR